VLVVLALGIRQPVAVQTAVSLHQGADSDSPGWGQQDQHVGYPVIVPPWYPSLRFDVIHPTWYPTYDLDVILVPLAEAQPEDGPAAEGRR
jgi:hypothetical protein